MGRYFGTDGFRGEAGTVLTAEHAFSIGRFLGHGHRRVVIGRDTRHSSIMLESALSAGITASGADVLAMGVTTTPSVAFAVKKSGSDCAVMISASHNPYYDNGIKIISGDGSKYGDDSISAIEDYLDKGSAEIPYAKREHIGTVIDYARGREEYAGHLLSAVSDSSDTDVLRPFGGFRVALDLANGSACAYAADIFRCLGAEVFVMADQPDGFNINRGVGSTHLEALCRFVTDHGCDIGFAYDGDADRCLAVDECGKALNGDQLMFACARYLRDLGKLKDDMVVVTVMSNMGLLKALERESLSFTQVAVGDRYVWERMREGGYTLGGEQSGHIIFADHATTGDGILTSLMVMKVLLSRGTAARASDIYSSCPMYPQCLVNITVSDKGRALSSPYLRKAVSEAEAGLCGRGRILVRASGTEPVIRIMAEAETAKECSSVCEYLASVIRDQ